jgi:hypothetical protein
VDQGQKPELGGSNAGYAVAANFEFALGTTLFATGLGVLGLLGWRRKRRQAAGRRIAPV